jgi:hypothetical protein
MSNTWLRGKRFPVSFVPRYGRDSKCIYNDYKNRYEVWVWLHNDAREVDNWMLDTAYPIRQFEESFMGGILNLLPATQGIVSDKTWCVNGNPAPVVANAVQSNYWIGGLALTCLAAADNDWVAMHMGSNYPVRTRRSPNLRASIHFMDIRSMVSFFGLVAADNLETGNGNPWTVPDTGIWVEYDDSVSSDFNFVTSRLGVQTVTSFEMPTSPNDWYIQVSNDGTSVKFFIDCDLIAEHDTNLPDFEGLKILFMVGRHGAIVTDKSCLIQEINLMYDK